MAFPRVFSLLFKNDRLVGAGHVEQVTGPGESFCLVGDERLREALQKLPQGPRSEDIENLLRGTRGWHAWRSKGREASWFQGGERARLELSGDNVLVCVGCDGVPDWVRELKQGCEPKLLLRVLAAAGLKQEMQGTPSEIHAAAPRARNAAGDGPSAAPLAGKRDVRPLELTPVFTLLNTGLLAVLLLVTLWPLWPKRQAAAGGASPALPSASPGASPSSGPDTAPRGACDVLPDKHDAARAFCLRLEQEPPDDAAFTAERERVVGALAAAQSRAKLTPAAREAWGHVVAALHARLLLARYVESALPADQRRLDAAKPYEAALGQARPDRDAWRRAFDGAFARNVAWQDLWERATPPALDKLRAELVTPHTIKALPELLKAAEAASR